jgi:2-dehydropantoate 2-reductase
LTLPSCAEARTVREVFLGSDAVIELVEDFATQAWRKLLQNAVAGLMVLTGRRAGIYSRPDIGLLAEAYLRECLSVARADGAQLPDGLASQLVDTFRNYPPDLGTSILADRQAGRPLEWDQRNGVIVRRARMHGIATPISDVLVPLLAAASDGPG